MATNLFRGRLAHCLKALFYIVVLAAVLIAPGCGVKRRQVEVRINITPEANKNSPVAVDLLLVRDSELVKELLKVPASEWFAKRNQYKQDYPQQLIEGGSWEWVPGQNIPIQMLSLDKYSKLEERLIPKRFRKVRAAIIYANYSTPGAHRARVEPYKNIKIDLMANDFTVEVVK